MPGANPIDNHWSSSRPSQHEPTRGVSSPTFADVKEKAGEAGELCCNTCCNAEVREHLATLIQYTATIVIALALYSLIFDGFLPSDKPLWLLWVMAVSLIITSMVICFFTRETLHFGEDIC